MGITQSQQTQKKVTVSLHPAEWKLIECLRALQNGTLTDLRVSDGLPVSAEEMKGKVKFI